LVRQATDLLTTAVRSVDDERLSGAQAAELARAFARVEKIAAAATVALARVTKDPGGVLSDALGTAAGAARRKLETAQAATAVPILHEALRSGDLSLDQAGVVAPVAAVSITEAARLVAEAANGTSLVELKATAARRLRAFRNERDEVARERALHARRYCRLYEVDGGIRVDALLSGVDAARFGAALRARTDAAFRSSWSAGATDATDQLRADALVEMVAGGGSASGAVGAQVVLRVDAAALARGAIEDGEVCEIDGIGEVSLATARSLLPDASLTTLLRDGADIRTVTSSTRVIPRKVRVALSERDRTCVVPGCGRTQHLEIDHWRTDFAAGGLTALSNLCRLCPVHHRMKSRTGFHLSGGPGRWTWSGPIRR